jgi:predicted phosphodiesterase
MTSYFRTTVEVSDLSAYQGLEVYLHVDDGCVVYVNGVEAFRRGIDDGVAVSYDTAAKFKPKEETFTLPASLFTAGKNVIAVEVHQDGGDSSDLWFELGVVAVAGAKAEAAAAPQATLPDPNAPLGEVSKVTITFAGDVRTAKGFTWYTTLASAGSDLQVVEKAAGEPDFAGAMKFAGRSQVSTNSPAEAVHKAEAVGLKPDTAYFFRVGDEALNLWSGAGSFSTAADGAFTFIDLADSQAKSEDEAKLSAHTFQKALETVQGASFVMINGDIVDTGSNEAQWNWLLGSAKDILMNIPFVPAAGNHDEDVNSFIEHFDVVPAPFSATETGAYYSFDYGSAHFIVLNTNEDSKRYADFTPAQIQWLKGDAVAAKANGARWLIAVLHKGPYTTSNHATDEDIMSPENGVRALVAPLFNQLGVDLVFQGHDHIYARTKPIADGAAADAKTTSETLNGMPIDYAVKPQGTVYVIPATAGAKVYYKNVDMPAEYYDLFAVADENHAAPYGADPDDASRPVRGAVQNFMGITIDGDRLTAVTYEIDRNKDPEKPYIVDQFGITK